MCVFPRDAKNTLKRKRNNSPYRLLRVDVVTTAGIKELFWLSATSPAATSPAAPAQACFLVWPISSHEFESARWHTSRGVTR